MERQEVADAALAAAQEGLAKAKADVERAVQLRDDALADIADSTTRHEAARAAVVGEISPPLLATLRPDPEADRDDRRRDAQGAPVPGLPDRALRQRAGRGAQRGPARGGPLRELRPDPGAHRRVGPVSRRFIVEADGGSRGNPGPAGYGALVRDAATGKVLAERAASVGRATNNVAEYGGLVAGLQAALDLDASAQVEVRMDSKLVVEQMSGRWKIKHPDMQQLALQAQKIARQLGGVTLHLGAPRAERCRRRPGQQRDGRQADPPRRRRRAEHGRGRRPALGRAGAAWSRRSPTCCGTGRPSTPRSVGTAAVTSCRCRGRGGPRRRRRRSGPRNSASTSSSPRRCGGRARRRRSSPRRSA